MAEAKRRRIWEKTACSHSMALPPELVQQLVLPYLAGCDLAAHACAAKPLPAMTLKTRAMAVTGQTSFAARLWDARLRKAHGDEFITHLRVDGCIEWLGGCFSDCAQEAACFELLRLKFEGPPLSALLLSRVDAGLRRLG